MSLLTKSFKHNSLLKSFKPYIPIRSFWGSGETSSGFGEPFYAVPNKYPKICSTALEAVEDIKSNDRVFIHGAAATPTSLIFAMCEHAKQNNLKHIEPVHIHLHGETPFVYNEYKKHFRDNSLFIGGNVRKAVNEGFADFTPIFLSEIPQLFESKEFKIDCAIVQVSLPDKHGYLSLGTSVDCARSAILGAKHIIGLVNGYMPRTHGDGHIHISHFNKLFYENTKIPELSAGGGSNETIDPNVVKIGEIIANELISDKACLQMGIGGIPDAVLSKLFYHKDLGIHTEMFSDGVLDLVEAGVVSNQYKNHHVGKIVSSFTMGTQKLYDFIHDNPLVLLCDCSYVNDVEVIRSNPSTTALNSCIEIDLTGQVCADSIGSKMFSGIGGQMDFMRGAKLSQNGKAIMAITTRTNKGLSKIQPFLKAGAGVVTTRAHVQYIVTEYGWVNLHGKTLRERAKLLISICHPDDQETLEKAAIERFGELDLYSNVDLDTPIES